MAKFAFTSSEKIQINSILRELDPSQHELLAPFRSRLTSDDWDFVCDYARAEIRAALEIGLMGRTIAEFARNRGTATEDGITSFLTTSSWMRNFGVSDDADEAFKLVATVDSPLFVAVDALLQIAQDRLFGTLDDEYERLLDTSA